MHRASILECHHILKKHEQAFRLATMNVWDGSPKVFGGLSDLSSSQGLGPTTAAEAEAAAVEVKEWVCQVWESVAMGGVAKGRCEGSFESSLVMM